MEEKKLAKKILCIIEKFEDPKIAYAYAEFSEELKKAIGDVIDVKGNEQRVSGERIQKVTNDSVDNPRRES